MTPVTTSIHDVVRTLSNPSRTTIRLNNWRFADGGRPQAVQEWATNYVHTPATLNDVMKRIQHSQQALGNIPHTANKEIVRDAYAPWPITFLFHRCRMEVGRIPGPAEFWHYLDAKYPEDWVIPITDCAMTAMAMDQPAETEIMQAMMWRAGIAWLSCVREMHMIALLHEWGIPARYHPIADVVLRADGWCGRDIFMLYVPNPQLERKESPESIFPPHYRIHHLPVSHQGFGKVWLVSEEALAAAIDGVS